MSPPPGAPLAPQQALDADNPFPGLLPFEERDASFFFGRDAEMADLFERVRRETLTVLFGRSGLGKTSLLRAGVFPMLREAGLLPIPVRLDFSERGGALRVQVQAAIVEVIAAQGIETSPPGAEQSLWEYFHATHFWGAGNRLLTPVLVFDQFEELFTLGQGDGRIGPFITELADLIENYIPASVRARVEASGEPLAFGYEQQNYRVVVGLREDYLPDLEALRGPIPSLGRNRVRLAHLDGRNALQAIVKPAPDLVSREVAAHIVRYVAGQPGVEHEAEGDIEFLEIDPAILSLACRELNERRRAAGLPVITTELLAGARERILPDFYEQGFRDLPKAVRELVEDRLITGSGHRRAEALDDVLRLPGVTEEAIARLVDRRLLRREERLGIPCIELSHDVLSGVVRESRDARHAAELRGKHRRRGMIAGGAAVAVGIAAITLAAVFGRFYLLAETHRAKAESLINFMLFDLRDRLEPLGRLDILEPAAKQAMEYFDQRVGGDATPESARKRLVALANIADVWRAQGKREAALDVYRKALAIAERLAAQDPGNAGWQRDVSVSYNRIGDVRRDEGDRKGALAAYEKALAITERLAAEDPANAAWQRDVSLSYE
ncbi:MAG: tetratricopeptide repeat protein, partial [Gammaproteobacteria bacterium]